MSIKPLSQIKEIVLAELNSFEISELTRVIEGIEVRERLATEVTPTVVADDISCDGTLVYIVSSYEMPSKTVSIFRLIHRNVLGKQSLTLREKMDKITIYNKIEMEKGCNTG